MLQIFRVLLPSWKFFDGTTEAPELFYRFSHENEAFGEWVLCIPKVERRSFKNLWVNANENFLFASHALLEYLKNDLETHEDARTSLNLVENLVRFQIQEKKLSAVKFQFRVGLDSSDEDALYTSQTLEVLA